MVSIDSATAEHPVSTEASALIPLPKSFKVGKDLTLNPSNYDRYHPYVELAQSVDPKKLVDVYFRYYPLFQAAYRDLSPQKYFNDRLVEVIDSLLETPEVKDPIKLKSDSVRYKFDDASLEERPVGQKLLIRMGSANARVIKSQLKKIRELVSQTNE